MLAKRYHSDQFILECFSQDGAFVNDLRNYAERDIHKDIATVTSGGQELTQLRQLLAAATKNLET